MAYGHLFALLVSLTSKAGAYVFEGWHLHTLNRMSYLVNAGFPGRNLKTLEEHVLQ